jgi:peptidoglycan/xylan/chitin deacetylase (PgdA/CDA1 family)
MKKTIENTNIAINKLAPSMTPPGGIPAAKVPMFVSFGFDDNEYPGYDEMNEGSGGMLWAIELFKNRFNPSGTGKVKTFDASPCRVTFFNTGLYISVQNEDRAEWVKKSWYQAFKEGHEIGNHSFDHATGGATHSEEYWYKQLTHCNEILAQPYAQSNEIRSFNKKTGVGVEYADIKGFRAPFLEFNDNLFKAIQRSNIQYDTSIQEGAQEDQLTGQHYWPYTLDHVSPGNEVMVKWGVSEPLGNYPGLWELPVYPFIVPDDDAVKQYGLNYSLRDVAASRSENFFKSHGKITGFDYNLLYLFKFNKDEVLAILKHTLDLRLLGNRCPMLLGMHTGIYHDKRTDLDMPPKVRREIVEEFIDYALSKSDVRFVRFDQVLQWLKSPSPLI